MPEQNQMMSERIFDIDQKYKGAIWSNDDVAVQNRIKLIGGGSLVAAIMVFLGITAIYFILVWLGVSNFNSAVVAVLAMLSFILYAVDISVGAVQELLLFLRADNRAHYEALQSYQKLSLDPNSLISDD